MPQTSTWRPRFAARRIVLRATWSNEPPPAKMPGISVSTASALGERRGPSACRKRRYEIQSHASGCSGDDSGMGACSRT